MCPALKAAALTGGCRCGVWSVSIGAGASAQVSLERGCTDGFTPVRPRDGAKFAALGVGLFGNAAQSGW